MDDHKIDISDTTIRRILQQATVPPLEININIKLTGRGAGRYYFTSLLLQNTLKRTEEEIAHYFLRTGVELELSKLGTAIDAVKDLPIEEKETEYAL